MYRQGRDDLVRTLIAQYVNIRPIAQVRDWSGLLRLAQDIVAQLEAEFSIWRKWSLPREAFAKSAVGCWIPIEDLRAFLNAIPGPELTTTDVAQRLRAFCEEECEEPNPDLKDGCLVIYAAEKAEGTELAAIVGRLREHVDAEEVRRFYDQQDRQKREGEERRLELEQSFLAGEDCKWTPVDGSEAVCCRVNGRAFRLMAKEGKTRSLFRITALDDPSPRLIGKYQNRGDATKIIAEIAYQPEPRR
jgi:hypothetical protein